MAKNDLLKYKEGIVIGALAGAASAMAILDYKVLDIPKLNIFIKPAAYIMDIVIKFAEKALPTINKPLVVFGIFILSYALIGMFIQYLFRKKK